MAPRTRHGAAAAHALPPWAAGSLRPATLNSALVLYLVVTIAAVGWLPVPEVVRAALATPALALIPLLVGLATLRFVPAISAAPAVDGFGRLLLGWLLGSFVLASIAVLLQLTSLSLLLREFGLIALALTVIAAFAWRSRNAGPMRMSIGAPVLVGLAISALLAVAPKALAARYTEFPFLTGNVVGALHFGQPALRLIEHGYLDLDNPSHGPGIVTLLAMLSQLYGADPLSLLWMAPFLLFAVFGVGLFLWTREVTGRVTSALLVAAVGVFLPVEPIFYSATPLVLRSNTILFALFPFALYLMHKLVVTEDARPRMKAEALIALQGCIGALFIAMNAYRLGVLGQEARMLLMLAAAAGLAVALAAVNRSRWHWPGLPALLAVIVSFQVFHVFEGPVFLTAFISYGIALTLPGFAFGRQAAIGVCVAVGAFFFAQYVGLLTFPEGFSLSSSVFGSTYEEFSYDFAGQVDLLQLTLSPIATLLLLFGIGSFLVNKNATSGRAVIVAMAVMTAFFLLPDPFAFRLNKSFAPFMALLIVAGAFTAGTLVSRLVRRRGKVPLLFQHVAQLGLVAAVFPSFVAPLMESASFPARMTIYPQVAESEYALGDWFEENTDEDVRVVSDTQTMLLVTSLANRVSIAERKFLLEEMSHAGREHMWFIKESVLSAPSACSAYLAIQSLVGSEPERERRFLNAIGATGAPSAFYVVWTPKTFMWATRPNRIDPVLSPVPTNTMPWWRDGMAPFEDPTYFHLEHRVGTEAYVFRARSATEVPAAALAACDAPTAPLAAGAER